MPAASWRTSPARTMSLWLTASASAGSSRSVGMRERVQRISKLGGGLRPPSEASPRRSASRRTSRGWGPAVRGERSRIAPAKPALEAEHSCSRGLWELLGQTASSAPGYHAAHAGDGRGFGVTPAFLSTLVGLGFIGAFTSGLVGVGGAIVMIPLVFYVPPLLGVGSLDIKMVAGVTMAQVLAGSAMGAWTHGRGAMVHRGLALWGGTAMALGSLAGAVASRFVGGRVLLIVFAIMATAALPLMFVEPAQAGLDVSAESMPFSRGEAVCIPGMVGLLSGL